MFTTINMQSPVFIIKVEEDFDILIESWYRIYNGKIRTEAMADISIRKCAI